MCRKMEQINLFPVIIHELPFRCLIFGINSHIRIRFPRKAISYNLHLPCCTGQGPPVVASQISGRVQIILQLLGIINITERNHMV